LPPRLPCWPSSRLGKIGSREMTVRLHTATIWLSVLLLAAACGSDHQPPSSTAKTARAASEPEWFADRAKEYGLDFVHFNGMSGEFYYPEIMAPGVALFDYDNDGDLDVYVVQGQMLGNKPLGAAVFPPNGPLRDRLFRNDLTVHEDGTHSVKFTDVTEQSGIDLRSYGMGDATG